MSYTELTKPIHRKVIIEGEEYIASLEPGQFTLRQKGSKETHKVSIASLLEPEEEEPPKWRANRPTHERSMSDNRNMTALHDLMKKDLRGPEVKRIEEQES